MTRPLPPALLNGQPFLVSDAKARGVPYEILRGDRFRQICRDVYVAGDVPDTERLRLATAKLVLPASAVVTGRSAAWLLGVDIAKLEDPLEVTLPRGVTIGTRGGLLRPLQADVPSSDIVVRRGVPVTRPMRTAFDLARLADRVEAVVALDAFWHKGTISPERLLAYAAAHPGWRGVRRIADLLALADRFVDSPMETRLRLLLVLEAGLSPETQIRVVRADGSTAARLDMGFRWAKVGVEYDGQIHGEKRVRVRDYRRHNELQSLGWINLRYGADDFYNHPDVIIREVTEELRKRT